jgi:hypothetical protein
LASRVVIHSSIFHHYISNCRCLRLNRHNPPMAVMEVEGRGRKVEYKFRVYWNGIMLYSEKGDFVIYKGSPRLNEYGDMIGLGGECSSLMQFTGLCDKNGREIYEKDILQDDDGNRFEVVWNKYSASFELLGKRWHFLFAQRCIDLLENIGNAYENSELLQESTHGTT